MCHQGLVRNAFLLFVCRRSWKPCPSGVPIAGIIYGGHVVSVTGVVEVIGLDGPAGAMVLSVIIGI